MKAHSTWNVLPHGPIQRLAENLWRVEGTLADMDLGLIEEVRRVWQFFRDRRPETYGPLVDLAP